MAAPLEGFTGTSSCPQGPATGLRTKCNPQRVSVGLSVEAYVSKNLRILEFGRFLAHF